MMRLSPAMTWSRHGSDIYIHAEDQVLLIRDCPAAADALMLLLETGCDAAAVEAVDLEPTEVAAILDVLRNSNCLVDTLSDHWIGTSLERQADYFSALGANPDDVQSILGSAHIAILGIGGIGSITLAHLVAAGIGRFTLIDGDTVQPSNLNRQFIYRAADVGRLKVEAAADWVNQRDSAAVVRTVPQMLTDAAALAAVLVEGTSLLVMAADAPSDIALRAARACLETGIALMSADCGLRTASWGPLLEPGDLDAYMSVRARSSASTIAPPPAQPMKASFGPTNAIVASYMAKDILNWLAGLAVPSLRAKVTLDFEAVTARFMSVADTS